MLKLEDTGPKGNEKAPEEQPKPTGVVYQLGEM